MGNSRKPASERRTRGVEVEGATDEGGVAGAKRRDAASKNVTMASKWRGDRVNASGGAPHFQFLVNAETP